MQQKIEPAAEELIEAAFAALTRQDWPAFASLLDPEQVDSFRQEELDRRKEFSKVLTIDDFRRDQPDMPEAVAEYHLAQFETYQDSGPESIGQLYGVATLDELAELSPVQM